jgi:hypothetical protein
MSDWNQKVIDEFRSNDGRVTATRIGDDIYTKNGRVNKS